MNFIKGPKKVLEEYGIVIKNQRKLKDDDYIEHFELNDPIWIEMKDDTRIQFKTDKMIQEEFPDESNDVIIC